MKGAVIVMGVLEDVLLNAKSAAENVGKKATEIADLSKLKMNAAQLSREISNQFELIGRAVYDAKKADENADQAVQEGMDAVDALYQELSSVTEKIQELKKTVTCPGCGAKLEKGNAFCPKCGAKL